MARTPEFGRVLRHARLEKDLRQQDVAHEIHLTPEYYARIERGHALGAVDTLAALRAFLGFDANRMLAALDCRSKPVSPRRRASIPRPGPARGPHGAFSVLLKRARLERDLTQTGVATAIGCTTHHYNYIEAGQRLPSIKTFAKLHHCLGFDANELLDALIRMPKPFEALGQQLGEARRRALMDVSAVAGAVGCGTEQYGRIEAGAELSTILVFVRLHRVLGFDVERALRSIPIGAALDPGEVWGPHYEFGRLLKQARLEREMVLADVARLAAVGEHWYVRLEAGCQLPSLQHFARLQRCLGFDAQALLEAIHGDPRPFTDFGQQIASARTRRKRTEAEAAAGAGCELDRYQRIESGAELPTLMELVRLHRILDFDAEEALYLIPVDLERISSDGDDSSQMRDRGRARTGHAL